MLRMTPSCPVYLALGPTDLRNNIDGLLLKIKFQFELDPFNNALFVFCNRSRNKLKILFWDKNGFWLYYRRLDSGTFNWPNKADGRKTLPVRYLGRLKARQCYFEDPLDPKRDKPGTKVSFSA